MKKEKKLTDTFLDTETLRNVLILHWQMLLIYGATKNKKQKQKSYFRITIFSFYSEILSLSMDEDALRYPHNLRVSCFQRPKKYLKFKSDIFLYFFFVRMLKFKRRVRSLNIIIVSILLVLLLLCFSWRFFFNYKWSFFNFYN